MLYSLGAVLAQNFADRYPEAVQSLACFGGYDINNFDAEIQKKNEPQCSMIVFENAGHCVNMDAPQKFNSVMEEFWLNGNLKD